VERSGAEIVADSPTEFIERLPRASQCPK